jgi:uncharacterized membrane protein YbhN (UPF0104 family)
MPSSFPTHDEPASSDRADPRWRIAQALLLAVGLVGLAIAVRTTMAEQQGNAVPGVPRLALAYLLAVCSTACAAQIWVALLDRPGEGRHLAGAVYLSQLSKYVPAGGVLQAAGQIGRTATQGIPLRRVTLAWFVAALTTVCAGGLIGGFLVFSSEAPAWSRWISPLGFLAPLLLHRRVLHALTARAHRLFPRVPAPDELPSSRARLRALGWAIANLACYSGAFTLLLEGIDASVPAAGVFVAYVVSWVIGFLAIPVPSGLGVREVVLVALVPSVAAGPLLAASLTQRLVVIAGEVTAAAGNRINRQLRK